MTEGSTWGPHNTRGKETIFILDSSIHVSEPHHKDELIPHRIYRLTSQVRKRYQWGNIKSGPEASSRFSFYSLAVITLNKDEEETTRIKKLSEEVWDDSLLSAVK